MGVPKTFVLCPDDVPTSGGIRKLYRLVDVLNANGFPAVIVHQAAGFRCRWFENKTPVVSFAEARLAPNDLLVGGGVFLSATRHAMEYPAPPARSNSLIGR